MICKKCNEVDHEGICTDCEIILLERINQINKEIARLKKDQDPSSSYAIPIDEDE